MFLHHIGLLSTSSGEGYKFIPECIEDDFSLTDTSGAEDDNHSHCTGIRKGKSIEEEGKCYERSLMIEVNHNISSHVRREYKYILYPERWKVLFAFSTLTCINSWIWITWSPLAPALTSFWSSKNVSEVDELSSVFMYVYIPLSFPALYLLNRYRLRKTLMAAALLNFIGSIFRHYGLHNYAWVYFGTLLCAIAQTVTLAVPPLLSGIWFGSSERGLATSLGVFANNLGTALGLGMTVFIDLMDSSTTSTRDRLTRDLSLINQENLERYIGLQKVLSGLSLGFIILWIKSDQPLTPPSEAAAALFKKSTEIETPKEENDEIRVFTDTYGDVDIINNEEARHTSIRLESTPDYIASIRLYFETYSGIALFVVYGIVVGVFYAIATFLAQMFVVSSSHQDIINSGQNAKQNDTYWSAEEAGYLGLTLTVIGLFGPIISGEILDRTKAYRGLSIALLLCSSIAMIVFTSVVKYHFLDRKLVYISIGCLGFFLAAFISIGFEYGTAISYPADEAAVAGILNISAQIGGWILIVYGGKWIDQDYQEGIVILNETFIGTLVFALLLFIVVAKQMSKRPV